MSSERSGASVEQLYRELAGDDEVVAEPTDSEYRSAEVVSEVLGRLFPEESFAFDEEQVKLSLDEILLVLVALRESETHGKGLMDDLAALFDAQLSPGTVYPRLHELEEDDILEMHELVRTKEYRLDDPDAARARVESAMQQHLALGFIFYSALQEF
ncbi:MAG: hypothetical protein ACI8UR_002347 [Natronomonas sp.]|jgi:hypothetical protein|uniref:PadR family transcriptional regulator n=1 Tax=Natronomonas sp. TaxID=2184060 RepID=UPI003988C5FC